MKTKSFSLAIIAILLAGGIKTSASMIRSIVNEAMPDVQQWLKELGVIK